jgi:hypothetical protein
MLETLSGIVMLARLWHAKKALPPMLVTLCGMVMYERFSQPLKAADPMLITPYGIVILQRLVHQLKASTGIDIIVLSERSIETYLSGELLSVDLRVEIFSTFNLTKYGV